MDEKALKRLIKRRHPHYEEMRAHWDFLDATYNGGRKWFAEHIFRYLKEGETEYGDRVERAYRFNHTREVVHLVNKYIFRSPILRNVDDAPPSVTQFWNRCTRDGASIDQYMRALDIRTSIFGRIWVMTDTTATGDLRTVRDQKQSGAMVYSYTVSPQNVLDVGYDQAGEPLWVLFYEPGRDDEDPFTSTGEIIERYRLWTRQDWFLIEVGGKGQRAKIEITEERRHGLGEIPGFPLDVMGVSENPYHCPALINDIAYLDRAVANYLSNLDAIIQDQTFSQLAMPAQASMSGDDETREKLIEMGTRRVFLYDGEGGARPEYLSPDPRQAQLIVEVIKQIINEIYHSVGMAGERTKQDNSMGIDNSSGVAKAFDFERVNSLLAAKADSLSNAENRLTRLVKLWHGDRTVRQDPDKRDEYVTYSKNFDIRGLMEELSVAERLHLLDAPEVVRREQMRAIVEKMFPHLSDRVKAQLRDELKQWPDDETPLSGRDDRPLPAEIQAD